MTIPICAACGTSFPEAASPPRNCPICEDERQYVPAGGQRWTDRDALAASHENSWRQLSRDVFEIRTTPAFAIGQRAFLIRTPHGNVLWDCIALVDDATKTLVDALGGIAAIAISHPHYYTTMQDWADAFDAPVLLHANDREWAMRPHPRLVFFEEETREIVPGVTIHRLGGHFAGGTVLHVDDSRNGALFVGDIVQVGADRKSVSFLWSYPNRMPLSGMTVGRIAARLEPLAFERVYGAFGLHVASDGQAVVQRSAARYRALLEEMQP